MRVIYMGKNKPSVVEGLRYLLKQGVEVAAVVGPVEEKLPLWGESLVDAARSSHLPVASDARLYDQLSGKAQAGFDLRGVDLVISYLYWRRIQRPLIELPRIGCLNFHPAPLPEFRGVGGYNVAILEGLRSWGASAHFVEESFDTGDVIEVRRFAIDPKAETAFSLEQRTMQVMLELFKGVMQMVLAGLPLPRTRQGAGRYISKQEFQALRRIKPEDTLEEIERKIRAFWYPPQHGACIEIGGKEFTLVSEELLRGEVRRMYRK